jgi:hypothetical protein
MFMSLYNLASVGQAQGDYERASRLFDQGLTVTGEMGDRASTAYCLEGLGAVALARDDAERATRLFGAASSLLEAIGNPTYVYTPDRALLQERVETARARLGDEAFRACWEEGRSTPMAEAISYALAR